MPPAEAQFAGRLSWASDRPRGTTPANRRTDSSCERAALPSPPGSGGGPHAACRHLSQCVSHRDIYSTL